MLSFTANITKRTSALRQISPPSQAAVPHPGSELHVAPLGSQGTQNNSFNFFCPSAPGLYELNATVDSIGVLTESNENKQLRNPDVNCSLNYTPPALKPNYIPIISAPSALFVGQGFVANFTTRMSGRLRQNASSTTHVTFLSTVKNFTVVPLAVQQQQVDSWDFSCQAQARII